VKTRKQKRYLNLLSLLIICHYFIISSVATFCHNHEPDYNFNKNCPACQWQVQSQDDFSQANAIADALDSPLNFIYYKQFTQLIILPNENFEFPNLARAPPSLA
jgi:hypothetical protein